MPRDFWKSSDRADLLTSRFLLFEVIVYPSIAFDCVQASILLGFSSGCVDTKSLLLNHFSQGNIIVKHVESHVTEHA